MQVRRTTAQLCLAAAIMGLAGCSWFGGGSNQAANAPPPPPPRQQAAATAPVAQVTIRDVQTELQQAGYYKNQSVDGVWGRGTERAVRQFQRDHDIPSDGKLDVPTLQALNLTGTPPSTSSTNNPNPDNRTPTNQMGSGDNEPANSPPPPNGSAR